MPQPFERHRRSKWEWGSPGSRSSDTRGAAADDPDPGKRTPGRKDTRRWCRGKTGVEHVPSMVRVPGWYDDCRWRPMYHRRNNGFAPEWTCCHREVCARCGKVLREPPDLADVECPDYPGGGDQRAGAEEESREATLRGRSRSRKPVISGPQGYRRRRST